MTFVSAINNRVALDILCGVYIDILSGIVSGILPGGAIFLIFSCGSICDKQYV